MRDTAAEAYRVETGDVWRPRRGSHTSAVPDNLTSSMIDARDFQRARRDRENTALLPQGTLVAVTGGKQAARMWASIIRHLDRLKAKYDDVVLVHGGGPGVEKIASKWAERNGVHQIVCKPDWDAHGRAAPFRRNDELLDLLPKGVIAFPGSGITDNLVDKARKLGIPVQCGGRLNRTHTGRAVTAPRGAARSSFVARPAALLTASVRILLHTPSRTALRTSSRSSAAAAPSIGQHPRRFPFVPFAGFGRSDAVGGADFATPNAPGVP